MPSKRRPPNQLCDIYREQGLLLPPVLLASDVPVRFIDDNQVSYVTWVTIRDTTGYTAVEAYYGVPYPAIFATGGTIVVYPDFSLAMDLGQTGTLTHRAEAVETVNLPDGSGYFRYWWSAI